MQPAPILGRAAFFLPWFRWKQIRVAELLSTVLSKDEPGMRSPSTPDRKLFIALALSSIRIPKAPDIVSSKNIRFGLIFVLLFFCSFAGVGQVRLPRLISDGMVLQRDAEVKIWGWAASNERISVLFVDSTYRTRADSNGEWFVTLSGLRAGGPHTMQVNGSNAIAVKNIMVGDVWVCSGQSNMELTMKRASPIYEAEIANSANEYIRQFSVPQQYDFNESQKDLRSGRWVAASPENILDFSAVAYFFAKELNETYRVPIGLVNASLGGSPAEAWMSEEALGSFPAYLDEAKRFKDSMVIRDIEEKDRKRIQEWHALLWQKDEGYKNPRKRWYDPKLKTSNWSTMVVPGYWADTHLGAVNGVVWFRKRFNVTASIAGKEARLILGRIVDADSVFINGVFVGTTSYQYPPRRYVVPANVLKKGENTIVVRVVNSAGRGGFVLDKPYEIHAGDVTIDLKGEWQYRLGAKMDPLAGQTFIRWKPLGLHNAMLVPLFDYRIKGVIWYQGESNANRPVEYRYLFPAMIRDWRDGWKQGDFPFLYVQLPNFMEPRNQPGESNWALLREAQFKTLSVSNTAMAVAIDIGEWNDIHPLNKKDVGKRLALGARRVAYGEDQVVFSGPTFQSMRVDSNKVIITFSNTGSGLTSKAGELKSFALAAADKHFVWANARIEGNEIIVWNDAIPNPVAVRYAWADNPEGANLYNKEGLPASPFRTDDWKSP
jgi:sialate O-acetylesterase